MGNYVFFLNIYVLKGMWDDVDIVRDLMKDIGLRKNSGCSWIEIKNKIYMFLVGDKENFYMVEII